MGTKTGSNLKQSYSEDFEPFCNWVNEEARDVLQVHLPDFKKQQLRVQINVLRSLKISGERHLDERRRSRFRKEIRISQDCNADEIRAKFGRGILSIIMPKKTPSRSTQRNGKPGGEIDQSLVWRLRINRKTAVKVAAALVVIVAFGSYLAYRY
ncbi:Inactive protein RESTRICTED TEV MOVEMENT 2 [Morella rubra]|uniref:Inactive protein RESTRICTED TEV MOVEMENT 2 n=1 Tax=Morella rubra TaxID=262757 RepID=A0A6A1WKW1_9ROSI|nr:Inactive protein RESTRICTED TEV MOVEMENT 2 [Morella rubra]